MSCTLSSAGIGIHQLVHVTYQSPDSNDTESVHLKNVGSTVNVSCITNCSSNGTLTLVDVYPLSWSTGGDKGAVLTKNDSGVVNISATEKSNNSASRMLQLRASVINGTKWPKPFKCAAKVRLPDGDEFIRYGKTFSVDFTSELHLPSLTVCLSVCLIDCGGGCLSITSAHVPTHAGLFFVCILRYRHYSRINVWCVHIHKGACIFGLSHIFIFHVFMYIKPIPLCSQFH